MGPPSPYSTFKYHFFISAMTLATPPYFLVLCIFVLPVILDCRLSEGRHQVLDNFVSLW